MKFYTWEEIKTKVRKDIDIQSETFVDDTELLGYCNDAIDQAEAEILGLYEDYFISKSTVTLVQGQTEYDLPTDIFAHKIRRVVYNNGSTVYVVNRIRDWKKFEEFEEIANGNTSDDYKYFILNTTSGSPKMELSPPSRENGAYLKVYYIRNAKRLSATTDACDIPEFINFIYAFIKAKVHAKEGHPMLQITLAELEKERVLMLQTLDNMIPDADNEIEADFSAYYEMS